MHDRSGQSIKGYDLLECLGSGSSGSVYKANQSAIGRKVAIKIIQPEYANQLDFIRRFEAEARLIAHLEHPYIVPLIDFWRDPNGAFLVMRYLRGGSLKDEIRRGRLSLERTVLLLDQITAALELAHRNDFVHQNIHPGNILFDEDGNAYLVDFGITKVIGNLRDDNHIPAYVLGALDYLSPEQALNEVLTPQTDIYSLGVLLYEMLSGERPFYTGSSISERIKNLNNPLPELEVIDGRIAAINTIIQRATAKDPGDRYGDVIGLAEAFREAAGLDLSQSPSTVIEKLTLREQEVLKGVVDGLSNAEIAESLFLTLGTIKWYINQIYKKLGVRNRVQAIVRARELDLIVDPNKFPIAIDSSISVPMPEPENPYKGLRPFQAADHAHFFGRESLVDLMIDHFEQQDNNGCPNQFLALVGPSGSGKSSVVQAGLIPALWKGQLPGSEKWFVVDIKPGAQPLEELEIGLTRIAAQKTGNFLDQLEHDDRGLIQIAAQILPDDDSELLVVIDQFEELFLMVGDEDLRTHFLDLIAATVNEEKSRVRIVITLRADFYDRPLHYQAFGKLVKENLVTIMPLSAEELERAIITPADGQSVTFESGLVSTIIDDISYQPGTLPLLQYALTELFDRREDHLLTHQAYITIGGAVGALTQRAEDIFAELDPSRQEEVRQMFLRLVTLGEGVEDTRRRVERKELIDIANEQEVMDEIIDIYADYRLLSLDHDPTNRHPTVEVAHEALLREWDRLREWLNERREDIRSQRILSTATHHWQNANQDESYLLSGSRLTLFQDWAGTTDVALTRDEQYFLDESIIEEGKRHQRRRFIRNTVIAIIAAAFVLVSVLALWANNERGRAEDETVRAEIAEQEARDAEHEARRQASIGLAAQARLQLENGNQDVAIQLLLEALEEYPYTSQAESELAQAIEEYVPVKKYYFRPDLISIMETATWSPDGSYIAFGLSYSEGYSDALVILDEKSGEEMISMSLINNSCVPAELAWSPVDDRLISSYKTGTFSTGECLESPVIWDISTGEKLFVLEGHQGAVKSLDWAPDGTRIITAGEDGTTRIWDASSGIEILRLPDHSAAVSDARWSPQGGKIVTVSLDGKAIIYHAADGKEIKTIAFGSVGITGADWSPDGTEIAIVNQEGLARILDAGTGELLLTLIGHDGAIEDVGYSPGGNHIATLSNADHTARIWDRATGKLLLAFPFTGGLVEARNVSWSPDGNWFLFDREREIRNVAGKSLELTGHENTVLGGDWSPDGSLIITTSFDKTARIWDGKTGTEQIVLRHPDRVWYSDWSPDGSRIVTACADGSARIWDVITGELLVEKPLETSALFNASWSPDGSRIINSGFGSKATIWDPDSEEIIATFGLEDGIDDLLGTDEEFCNLFGPSWSPDSTKIVIGCIHSRENGTAPMILDGGSGELVGSMEDFGGGTSRTDWSLDGKLIASSHGSPDENVIRVWDADTGELLQSYAGHAVFSYGLSISPDGRRIASGDMNGVVNIWDVITGAEVLSFQVEGPASSINWSPDGRYIIAAGGSSSPVVRRVWPSLETLVTHAYECCSTRELTAAEREQFGLQSATNPE